MTNAYPDRQVFTFTSTGNPIQFQTEFLPTYVTVTNMSAFATTPGATVTLKSAQWNAYAPYGSAAIETVGGATNPQFITYAPVTNNGIYVDNIYSPSQGAIATFTGVTVGATTQLTGMANIGSYPSTGYILMQQATGGAQIQGFYFYYTLSGTTMTLPYLNSTGFGAITTGSVVLQINYNATLSSPIQNITSITTGTTTTVGFSTPVTFQVGDFLQLQIPQLYGTVLSNFFTPHSTGSAIPSSNYPGYNVTSIASANSVVINANTASLGGSFTFPTNAQVIAAINSQTNAIPNAIFKGVDTTKNTDTLAQQVNTGYALTLGSSVVGTAGTVMLVSIEAENQVQATPF